MQPHVATQGSLELRDVVRFQYAHMFRKLWPVMFFSVPLYLAGWVAIWLVPGNEITHGSAPELTGIWLAGSMALLYLYVHPWVMAWKQWRSQLSSPQAAAVRAEFTEEGASGTFRGTPTAVQWSSVLRFTETQSLFLLYMQPANSRRKTLDLLDTADAWFIPKRFLGADSDHLRAYLYAHLDPGVVKKPSWYWCWL